MTLTITAELVTELYESQGSRAIVLTSDGWSIESHPSGWINGHALAAVTREGIENYLDGYDFEQDTAEALTVPDQHGNNYTIPGEGGAGRPAAADAQVQVVTEAGPDEEAEPFSWRDAWWFDLNRATRMIAEPASAMHQGRRREVWRTEGGRYVQRTESIIGESSTVWPVTWSEITAEQAVERVYRAPADEIAVDVEELPAALHAARLAAQIVELLQAPRIADDSDPEVREARARRKREQASAVFADTALVSNLLRTRVTSDLREARGRAGQIVWVGFERNATTAARHLGVSRQTLQDLAGAWPDPDTSDV